MGPISLMSAHAARPLFPPQQRSYAPVCSDRLPSAPAFADVLSSSLEVRLSDPSQLFRSFWMGGYEGACHINRSHQRLDLIAATQHDVQAAHDYRLARS